MSAVNTHITPPKKLTLEPQQIDALCRSFSFYKKKVVSSGSRRGSFVGGVSIYLGDFWRQLQGAADALHESNALGACQLEKHG